MAKIAIIGSGIGGATMAYALADSQHQIHILERGEHLRDSPECKDAKAIFGDHFFHPDEWWLNGKDEPFNPGNYYYVGGNSKFYGAVMMRYRKQDFARVEHYGGTSPAWPFSYETLEPWYQKAEDLYQVCGDTRQDPSEPEHSAGYPYPAISHEPTIEKVRSRLMAQGLSPFALPLAVDVESWMKSGQTPWDAYPNVDHGKHEADSVALCQALRHDNVILHTKARVEEILLHDQDMSVSGLKLTVNGKREIMDADLVILSAGAVNSAALLLGSRSEQAPNGMANSSDCVGRYFMNHNSSAVMAIDPWQKNDSIYQKTLGLNDFYLGSEHGPFPLGNLQLLGKISGAVVQSALPFLPGFCADWMANHSLDWYLISEDLPNPESRVTLTDNNKIRLNWQRSNLKAHQKLVKKTRKLLKKAGYPIVLSRRFEENTPSHQCGTARMGVDAGLSVVNEFCQSHDHPNLYIVDAGFLPTSAAVNPALTIAAQALRVAEEIKTRDCFS